MAKFNLMHCIPHPRMHGLNGYKEVIESVHWGLAALGHDVKYSVNRYDMAATNILFGAQVLPIEIQKNLPANSIVYNFEQMRGLEPGNIRAEIKYFSERFSIWEYSQSNMDSWRALGVSTAKLVPVGYAPSLSRIPKPPEQDIDVLIYGMSGDKRLNALHRLSHAGLTTLFVSGLYGGARDALIARAKLVLNVNLYDYGRIFEIVRVSYLLANRKAVVAMLDPGTGIESDLADAIKFTVMDMVVEDCFALIENHAERTRLENSGYAQFARRDIKEILRGALM
jgi:hypothetical protein